MALLVINPWHDYVIQIGIDSWVQFHPMKYPMLIIWTWMHIVARWSLWQSNHKLLVDAFFLFENPKVALNHSTNASKSFDNKK
jgi:hypothetical protein